jgi:hypothetical protein
MNLETQNSADTSNRSNFQQHQSGGNSLENGSDGASDNFVELKYRSTQNLATATMAQGIGLFSIGLGLAEVLMPSRIGELAGVAREHRSLLPALGLREIAHGIGILKSAKPTTAVWTRVGGDVLDLAYLGASFVSDSSNKRRLVGATAAVLGVAALDLICASKLSSQNWEEVRTNPLAPTTVGQSSGRQSFSVNA